MLPDRALVIAICRCHLCVRSGHRGWPRKRRWPRVPGCGARCPAGLGPGLSGEGCGSQQPRHCCRRHLPAEELGRLRARPGNQPGRQPCVAPHGALATRRRNPNLQFPAVAGTFSCALNAPISEQATPAPVSAAASHVFRCRARHVDGQGPVPAPPPIPVQLRADLHAGPRESADDRRFLSLGAHYHRAWTWALILTEIAPDRLDAIVARGRAFGESRIICNAHWASDVDLGRYLGTLVTRACTRIPASWPISTRRGRNSPQCAHAIFRRRGTASRRAPPWPCNSRPRLRRRSTRSGLWLHLCAADGFAVARVAASRSQRRKHRQRAQRQKCVMQRAGDGNWSVCGRSAQEPARDQRAAGQAKTQRHLLQRAGDGTRHAGIAGFDVGKGHRVDAGELQRVEETLRQTQAR